MDAGPALRGAVEQAAKEGNVPLQMVATMEELAALCRVDVPSVAAGVFRNAADNFTLAENNPFAV